MVRVDGWEAVGEAVLSTAPPADVPMVPRAEVPTVPRAEVPTVPRAEVPTVPQAEVPTVPRSDGVRKEAVDGRVQGSGQMIH